jgi:hypothetical protein
LPPLKSFLFPQATALFRDSIRARSFVHFGGTIWDASYMSL